MAILEARLAASRQIRQGLNYRIITEGTAATKLAAKNARELASRRFPPPPGSVVDERA